MHDCWMTYSEENSGTLGMWWEQTVSAPSSFTVILQAQGNVEDHEDAGWTTSKTGPNYQWLSAWELHRTEQHGVQRCRWLWPSTLSNEEEPVQSSPVVISEIVSTGQTACSLLGVSVQVTRASCSKLWVRRSTPHLAVVNTQWPLLMCWCYLECVSRFKYSFCFVFTGSALLVPVHCWDVQLAVNAATAQQQDMPPVNRLIWLVNVS